MRLDRLLLSGPCRRPAPSSVALLSYSAPRHQWLFFLAPPPATVCGCTSVLALLFSSAPRPLFSSSSGGGSLTPARHFPCQPALMAQRMSIERVEGRAAAAMPFLVLRLCTGGVVACASDSIDLAQLLIAWTQLGRNAALVSTFESREAATSWLSSSLQPLPGWVRTCVASDDDEVVDLDDESDPSRGFVLLQKAGGHLVAKDNWSLVPRLVNTVKALYGEVAVVRMMSSMGDA